MNRLSLFLLCIASPVFAQSANIEVYCPAMQIDKQRLGQWLCANEPCELTIEYPSGRMDAGRARRKAGLSGEGLSGDGDIRPTPVRGLVFRAVDACVLHGTFSDGSKFTCWLPPEPIQFSRFERDRLRIKAVMVAVPIDAPCELVKPDGQKWTGMVRFPACEAHGIDRRTRLADEARALGELTKE
jgi:hypothetical protein